MAKGASPPLSRHADDSFRGVLDATSSTMTMTMNSIFPVGNSFPPFHLLHQFQQA